MRKLVLITLSLLSIISCGSSGEQKNPTQSSLQANIVKNSCLAESADKPCTLVNAETISSISGIAAGEMEMEEPHVSLKNPAYMMCSYEWPSDRTQTIEMMGISSTSKIDNSISFGSILILNDKVLNRYGEKTRTEYFEDFYTNSTEEEKTEAKKVVTEELDKNEELSESDKNVASSIMDVATNFSFTPVSEIGELASWEVNKGRSGGTLIVLHGNVIFKVAVNISDDNEPNLLMAKKVAQAILDQC